MNKYTPDHDEEWHRREYVEKGRSSLGIADELGMSGSAVRDRLRNYGIELRPISGPVEALRDEAAVREWYCEERMTMSEIADELDCSPKTVSDWVGRHGIKPRTVSDYASRRPAGFSTGRRGYERWSCNTENHSGSLPVHRLLAIAEGADPHKIFSGDYHVHHENGIRWDNRPSNIEVLPSKEHLSLHAKERRESGNFLPDGQTPKGNSD